MNDLHTLQKKLQFKSSHRGSKEMDILLGSFVEKYIKLFNEGELQMLEAIRLQFQKKLTIASCNYSKILLCLKNDETTLKDSN